MSNIVTLEYDGSQSYQELTAHYNSSCPGCTACRAWWVHSLVNDDVFIDIYNYLIESDYFTEVELELLVRVNGETSSTLNDAIFTKYGVHDLVQLFDEREV